MILLWYKESTVTTPAALADTSARVPAAPARTRRPPAGTLGRLRREPTTAAALVVLAVLVALAVAAPVVVADDPLDQDRQGRFLPPSLRHPFGTDEFGRDLWSRTVFGARVSLFTGGAVVLLAGTVGVPLGLAGGYAGGWTDAVVMRFHAAILDEAWVVSIAYRQSVFGLAKHVDGFAYTIDDMAVLENVSLEK
jgi:peptide/nickel transport system permease protein